MRMLAAICLAALLGGAVVALTPPLVGYALVGACVILVGAIIVAGRDEFVSRLAYAVLGLQFVDVSPITVMGSAVRLYQPLAAVLIVAIALRSPRSRVVRTGPILAWLVIFTALVATSYAWSISRQDTIVVAIGQSFLLALFAVVGILLSQRLITVRGVLSALWAGAAASSLIACLQFVLGLAGSGWGLQFVAGIPWGRPAGLMTEPDWGALVAAVGLVITLIARRSGSRYYRSAIFVFSFVVAVTLVRAVILALIVALACALLCRGEAGLRRQILLVSPVMALGIFLVLEFFPGAVGRLDFAGLGDSSTDGGALHSRLGVAAMIQERGPESPWFGHGAGTLAYETMLPINQERYVGGGELNAGRGSANLFLTSYWDLGWIGVAVTVGFVVTWLISSFGRRHDYPALFVLAVLLLVDFQANNGLRFGFVWVLMATSSWALAEKAHETRPARYVDRVVPGPSGTD